MLKNFITVGACSGVGNTTICRNLQEGFRRRNLWDIKVCEREFREDYRMPDAVIILIHSSNKPILNSNPLRLLSQHEHTCVLFNKVTATNDIDVDVYNYVHGWKVVILNSKINESEIFKSASESGDNIYTAGESHAVSQMNTVIEELLARYYFR